MYIKIFVERRRKFNRKVNKEIYRITPLNVMRQKTLIYLEHKNVIWDQKLWNNPVELLKKKGSPSFKKSTFK